MPDSFNSHSPLFWTLTFKCKRNVYPHLWSSIFLWSLTTQWLPSNGKGKSANLKACLWITLSPTHRTCAQAWQFLLSWDLFCNNHHGPKHLWENDNIFSSQFLILPLTKYICVITRASSIVQQESYCIWCTWRATHSKCSSTSRQCGLFLQWTQWAGTHKSSSHVAIKPEVILRLLVCRLRSIF